ncbi:MAG TPA: type II secretion system protein GspG [Polyangiaceae bacterium]|nr:type II secretion system protein GspG [Polyangiaceae bacterium]
MELRVLADQIEIYAVKHNEFPPELGWYEALKGDGLVSAGGERDPWGNAYVYNRKGGDFDLRTVGMDGKFATADDQVRAQGWRWTTCAEPRFWRCNK